MISLMLLSCFTIVVSAVPVSALVLLTQYFRCFIFLYLYYLTLYEINVSSVIFLLLYFQVYSNVLPSIQSGGGAANQKPEAPTQPLVVEQPQPGVPQQLGPQSGPQPVPSMPYHTWSPQGNRLMMIPLQHSLHGPQLANQPTFQQGVGHKETKLQQDIYCHYIYTIIIKYLRSFS